MGGPASIFGARFATFVAACPVEQTESDKGRRRAAESRVPQFIFERSEPNQFGGWTTRRGLEIQGFGTRSGRRRSARLDLLAQARRIWTAKRSVLHRQNAGPDHNAAPNRFDRRGFERRRGDARSHPAAGPSEGCQSQRSANRPERSPLAQQSAALGLGE